MDTIYFDNNATTPLLTEALDEMLPYLKEYYANPSSSYSFAHKVRQSIEKARAQVASLIGADEDEVVFTSSGTESNNTAIMSSLLSSQEKKDIVTSSIEHPAVLNYCKHMVERGYNHRMIPVDNTGVLNMDSLNELTGNNTAIVSIMGANNESGIIYPIDKIVNLLKGKNIIFHTDAVQLVGKVPVNVHELGIDLLSMSAHKLHGPKGIGVLYIKRGTQFHPYLIGGSQERGFRSGTENVAGIVGFGKACEVAKQLLDNMEKVKRLRDKLEEEILRKCPDTIVNGQQLPRLSNTSNMSFAKIDGEAVLMMLDSKGICASSGSACSSGSEEPSHVLKEMKVPSNFIRGSIRFSLSQYNTEKEIDNVISILPGIIEKLRALSVLK